jgi:secondary thiamine-phosphate synthase enzyme
MIRTLGVETRTRQQMLDITCDVQKALTGMGAKDGICVVFVSHTTAGVTINENADPDVCRDMISGMERLAPRSRDYHHAEGNSDAHIKTSLVGPSVTCIVNGGKLLLGTWQSIFFCEFDGPRSRTVQVKYLVG